MKGTPDSPQCGFSRAAIQILGLQGVDPKKFASFNVLEDPELRQGPVNSPLSGFFCADVGGQGSRSIQSGLRYHSYMSEESLLGDVIL
jgi:hypothetical protein